MLCVMRKERGSKREKSEEKIKKKKGKKKKCGMSVLRELAEDTHSILIFDAVFFGCVFSLAPENRGC